MRTDAGAAPLNLVFFGTADLACASLAALARSPDFRVAAVVTQPDRPKGRDLRLQPPPVKREALASRLPVLQPERARSPQFIAELKELRPDLIVVAAYGQILPGGILELPRFGCLNVHASLLPKYRGAAPIQWAILNDERETGITIMKMDAGLDTGDILTQERTPLEADDDAQSLHDRLARMGASLLIATLPDYLSGKIAPQKQPTEGVSYARKITKEDGRLDWARPARALWNQIRAFTPWPGAFTYLPQQVRQPMLKVWKAEVVSAPSGQPGRILQADRSGITVGCGEQGLRLIEVQREGGRRLRAHDFLAGHVLRPGEVLAPAANAGARSGGLP
jgi:methionyl-tRNA formyltransferase